ncbi:hypothetical protein BCR33DRAFT_727910 [Rhizoclosmatium globosum]|uniref:Single-stranded DNA-binding protein n=1 Tax=Rhizoclosmatium globosum TaxID=329046 RepID=A0A1Y2APA6_9FUNG|nr:hypothetical protein BCR33DRAFT_727910 [Rhizoclosmatium globosum]|eukprot:ORY23785.1 hypothetical protein BCR33DRAFT_727910 [Rhizoclosmatium globosum]
MLRTAATRNTISGVQSIGVVRDSSSFNKVILIGNVGGDPKYHSFTNNNNNNNNNNKGPSNQNTQPNNQSKDQAGGSSDQDRGVWSFSVATSRNTKRNNEWVSETDWHSIKHYSFANKFSFAEGKVSKGALVLVEGRLGYNKEEESGRTFVTVIADKVEVLNSRDRDERK